MSQQFCLKWNNHMNNMMDVFKSLLSTESMVDVTLACDGLSLKAHKMVLSACSPFFQSLFLENPCKHPIVILKDMKYTELKAIIEFMYHGEVNVAQDQLSALMKTAETLRVKGLAEVTNEKNSQSNNSSQDEPGHRSVPRTDTPPPSNKRRRGRTRKRSLSDSNRSDDDSNEPKIKQPMSPDIEELSGDVTMDASNSQFSNLQSQVPIHQSTSHSSNTYHKSSVISQDPQIEEPASADESEFGVEPAKLLEQTLTTDELNARRNRASNVETQRRSRSSADHSTIVPTSMSSDTSNQQPDSPLDIKPELLELDPPISPVAGTSHSSDNAMMMYMDQSSVSSHPGPSGYQDSTALVSQDSQPQETKRSVKRSKKSAVKGAIKPPVAKKAKMRVAKGDKKSVTKCNKKYVTKGTKKPVVKGAKKPVAKRGKKPVVKGAKKPVVKGAKKPVAKGAKKLVAKAAQVPVTQVSTNETNLPVHMCSYCSYISNDIAHLKSHIESHKLGDPVTCRFCCTSLSEDASLEYCGNLEISRDLITCDVCQQNFCSQLALTAHKLMHH